MLREKSTSCEFADATADAPGDALRVPRFLAAASVISIPSRPMQYGPFLEADEPELSEVLGGAFAFPPAEAPEWFERAGRQNMRVVREGERPIAGLIQIPMGHFLGGRSVRTTGVAGVGVAMDRRAANVGRMLMREAIREVAAQGVALSTLYPATQTLYRAVGYERAGRSSEYSLPVANLDPLRSFGEELTARRLTDDDLPSVRALYSEVHSELHGSLDRGPYVWSRVSRPRGRNPRGFGFFDGEVLEAYAYLAQARDDAFSLLHNLWATDLCARGPRGWAAIFKFCKAQRSMVDRLEFRQVPAAPFLSLLKENRFEETAEIDWMVRVTDVGAALRERGYPLGARARLRIAVRDEEVETNAGTWLLEVADGVASTERSAASEADATLDIRAFAQLYMGYLPAPVLRRLGLLEVRDEAALRDLHAVFASPMPACADMF